MLGRATSGILGPLKALMEKGEAFIVEADLPTMVARMNALAGGEPLLELAHVEREIRARDRQLDNPFSKDMQITALRGARAYLGDRLIRTAKPYKMLDPANGPLIAVRLNILTRKTLGAWAPIDPSDKHMTFLYFSVFARLEYKCGCFYLSKCSRS